MLDCVLTKPLSWTRPLKVSTLISDDLSIGSLKIAAFTEVVMAVSSMYWPVLSCRCVEAQPARVVRAMAANSTDTRLNLFMMKFLQVILGGQPGEISACWLTESTHAECAPQNAWSVRWRTHERTGV